MKIDKEGEEILIRMKKDEAEEITRFLETVNTLIINATNLDKGNIWVLYDKMKNLLKGE